MLDVSLPERVTLAKQNPHLRDWAGGVALIAAKKGPTFKGFRASQLISFGFSLWLLSSFSDHLTAPLSQATQLYKGEAPWLQADLHLLADELRQLSPGGPNLRVSPALRGVAAVS